MTTSDPAVDEYLEAATRWPDELRAMRRILLGCGLEESVKWNKPCYSHEGANIAILQEMKPFLALMFFKGALLEDPDGVLTEQGPNSRSARRITVASVDDVSRVQPSVQGLVEQAIAVEAAGLRAPAAAPPEVAPEFAARLDADPVLAAAFSALTPGRQREYHLHISGAKQAATRHKRVAACVPRILAGRGLRDR